MSTDRYDRERSSNTECETNEGEAEDNGIYHSIAQSNVTALMSVDLSLDHITYASMSTFLHHRHDRAKVNYWIKDKQATPQPSNRLIKEWNLPLQLAS